MRTNGRQWLKALNAACFAGAVVLWAVGARADGIDIAWFLTRVGGWREAPLRSVFLVLLLAVVNYVLNWIVIGLPSIRGGVSIRRVSLDLIGLTIIGQAADRIGIVTSALLASVAVTGLSALFHGTIRDVGPLVLATIVLNFLSSGILIGLLARHYVCRRWSQSRRRGTVVALVAAVLTNPAWAITTGAIPLFVEPKGYPRREMLHSAVPDLPPALDAVRERTAVACARGGHKGPALRHCAHRDASARGTSREPRGPASPRPRGALSTFRRFTARGPCAW